MLPLTLFKSKLGHSLTTQVEAVLEEERRRRRKRRRRRYHLALERLSVQCSRSVTNLAEAPRYMYPYR